MQFSMEPDRAEIEAAFLETLGHSVLRIFIRLGPSKGKVVLMMDCGCDDAEAQFSFCQDQ
jgi:hypothetical protein